MRVDAAIVAEKISEYLYHAMSREELNAWAQGAVAANDFGGDDDLRECVKKLVGPITWDDCCEITRRLGYNIRVELYQTGSRAQSGRTYVVPTKQPSQRRVTRRMTRPK